MKNESSSQKIKFEMSADKFQKLLTYLNFIYENIDLIRDTRYPLAVMNLQNFKNLEEFKLETWYLLIALGLNLTEEGTLESLNPYRSE